MKVKFPSGAVILPEGLNYSYPFEYKVFGLDPRETVAGAVAFMQATCNLPRVRKQTAGSCLSSLLSLCLFCVFFSSFLHWLSLLLAHFLRFLDPYD